MTCKDYVLIAAALRDSDAPNHVVLTMADALATTNTRFDFARFVTAASQPEPSL